MTTQLSSLYRKKYTWAVGIFLLGLLIGLYIFQLNALTQLAYHIAETEQHAMEIKHENTSLQTQAHRAVSLRDLEQLAQTKNFHKVTSVTYLRPISGSVAQNQ